MAWYFFDIYGDDFIPDEVGVDCDSFDALRREARNALPNLAQAVLSPDDDRHTTRVVVRDVEDVVVYIATLTFSGHSPRPPT
jgi:hypothetical protein